MRCLLAFDPYQAQPLDLFIVLALISQIKTKIAWQTEGRVVCDIISAYLAKNKAR